MYEETKTKQFQASVGRFSELEDMLYVWIDSMHCTSLPVQPSLLVLKAKQIAEQLLISEDDLKASWQWLSRFRSHGGAETSSPRCWKWFNKVFHPEVKKRTGRWVLLLMDTAPCHFSAFERNNVKVAFSLPTALAGSNHAIWV
ncbi:unnamed protein product [Clavelina lepadiformis]|uniref:HTH CENPB-type domain-containing protein n=1 Tax=Clavelina lepadiformis TaxID=159417 RepID=A0ABP0GAS4_CLALP